MLTVMPVFAPLIIIYQEDILLEHQTLASVAQLARDELLVNVERGEDRVIGQTAR